MKPCRQYLRNIAAGLTAVTAAWVAGAVTWPASAGQMSRPARAAAALAASFPGAGYAQPGVLLITGDRVATGPAAAVTGTTGPGGGGPLIQMGVAGRDYAIPPDALPYVGHGLDMSLFDVNAVARAEHDGLLPVRVTYSGRVPRLPGVTITRTSSGVASGYLTATSARTFGAALARLARGDRARDRYGADGMFAGGVRISLRSAAPAAAPAAPGRPRFPMRTLTVHGLNAHGRPDTGDIVIVANVDDPDAFGLGFDAMATFYHGVAKFSVPAGTYWATGLFGPYVGGWGKPGRPGPAPSGPARMVVLPQFTVPGHRTVTVDARTATSQVRFTTPLPATLEQAQVDVTRVSRKGQSFVMSDAWGPRLLVNPVSRVPADGTLETNTQAQLFSPASAASPYQYYLIVNSPRGTIPPQHFRVAAGSLATVHENLYADVPSVGTFIASGFVHGQFGLPLTIPELSVPGRDTVYLSPLGGTAVWNGFYLQGLRADSLAQQGGWVTYRPGQVATEDWNAYPLHTTPNVKQPGTPFGQIVSANRSGNWLTLNFMPFSDNSYAHLGSGYRPDRGAKVSGRYQIRQNGKTIASGNALNAPGIPSGSFYQQVRLSPKSSVISFTLTAGRVGPAYRLSTATSTTWTWRSAQEAGGTVPALWYCSLAGNHNCAAQPLPMLSYTVGGMALNGTAPAGTQSLTVTVGHLQLAAPLPVTKVGVQASFDDGKTWTSAAVTGSGDTYRAQFTAPAGAYVTLRVTAVTTGGAQVSETITRAYATAPSPAAPPGYRMACPAPPPGFAQCFATWAPQTAVNRAAAAGVTGEAARPAGWGARDIAAAYKLPVTRNPHQTVAVVEAWNTPHLASYLATYRNEYHLPPCTIASGCLRIVNEHGKAAPLPSRPPSFLAGWNVETTLDVDMVSAACPNCRILVVEGNDGSFTSLGTSEDTAARLGANAISNSYGTREAGNVMTMARAYDHPGHAIVVASGDSGFTSADFPANLTTVTAVGGTELARAKNKRGWTEKVWHVGGAGSGSGCSAYEPKPPWQHDPHCLMRTIVDVAAVAWKIPIYEAAFGGWLTIGGTSAAAPLIAGVYGLAGNTAKIKPGYEYFHARSLFNITTGNNDLTTGTGAKCGHDYLCTARKGYNGPTGLGTPHGTAAF